MHVCFIFVDTSAVYDHVCFQFGDPAFIPKEKYGPAQASQPSALPHVQPPNRLYARYTATSIPFQYINPSFFCKIQLFCPHIHFLSKYTFVVRRRAGIVAPVMQLLQRTPPWVCPEWKGQSVRHAYAGSSCHYFQAAVYAFLWIRGLDSLWAGGSPSR